MQSSRPLSLGFVLRTYSQQRCGWHHFISCSCIPWIFGLPYRVCPHLGGTCLGWLKATNDDPPETLWTCRPSCSLEGIRSGLSNVCELYRVRFRLVGQLLLQQVVVYQSLTAVILKSCRRWRLGEKVSLLCPLFWAQMEPFVTKPWYSWTAHWKGAQVANRRISVKYHTCRGFPHNTHSYQNISIAQIYSHAKQMQVK